MSGVARGSPKNHNEGEGRGLWDPRLATYQDPQMCAVTHMHRRVTLALRCLLTRDCHVVPLPSFTAQPFMTVRLLSASGAVPSVCPVASTSAHEPAFTAHSLVPQLPHGQRAAYPANASLLVSVRDKDNAIDMEALMGTWLSVAVGVPVGVGVGHAFRQTGMPWHSISPGRHSHIALTHWRVSSQALPQMPQFFWWVCRSTH